MIPAWYKRPDGSYGVIPSRALGTFPDGEIGFPYSITDNEKYGINSTQLRLFLKMLGRTDCDEPFKSFFINDIKNYRYILIKDQNNDA